MLEPNSTVSLVPWLLAAFFVAHVLFQSVFGILSLIGTIAAFVYLLDVKPALVSVTRRR